MKLKEILFLILEIYYSLCAPGQVWRKGTITGQSCINEQGWDLVTRGSIDLRWESGQFMKAKWKVQYVGIDASRLEDVMVGA